jgi:predicted nucleic acid-binding protein
MTNNSPKNSYVADTMAVVLRLEHRKLSPSVKTLFEQAEAGQAVIYIPALVLAEILYLSEKRRIESNLDSVKSYLADFASIKVVPLDVAVMEATGQISDIYELHDRIIAGTALALNLPIITNDPIITASEFVRAVW